MVKNRGFERKCRAPLWSYRDQEKLIKKAKKGFEEQVIKIFLFTGMHPSVMAEPHHYRLEISRGDISWNRPKTFELVSFPIPKEIKPFISDFIENYTGRSRQAYHDVVTRVARRAGLKDVSPLTLRHTYCVNELRNGRNPVDVARRMRASLQTVYNFYAELLDRKR